MENIEYFQVRLADSSKVNERIINGIKLTKKWLIKSGDSNLFALFKDVVIQKLVKDKNKFIPIAPISASSKTTVTESIPVLPTEDVQANVALKLPENNDFNSWSENQLKEYLIEKGADKKIIKTLTLAELIEQAQFIISQK